MLKRGRAPLHFVQRSLPPFPTCEFANLEVSICTVKFQQVGNFQSQRAAPAFFCPAALQCKALCRTCRYTFRAFTRLRSVAAHIAGAARNIKNRGS